MLLRGAGSVVTVTQPTHCSALVQSATEVYCNSSYPHCDHFYYILLLKLFMFGYVLNQFEIVEELADLCILLRVVHFH
jgi:hypothetical protein